MRRSLLAALYLGFLLVTPQAHAAILGGDVVEVKAPLQENVYATGGSVVISSPVRGDVVVFGGDVVIQAPVDGDVTAAGGTVKIDADVQGDVRVASSRLVIEKNHVGGDVVYAGSQIAFGPQASSSGAVLVQSGSAIFLGKTEKEVDINASEMTFGGQHTGAVRLSADNIQFLGGSKVGGELFYRAGSVQDAGAITAAKITVEKESDIQSMQRLTGFLISVLFFSVTSLLLAAMMMWVAPLWSLEVTTRMRQRVASSLFLGIFTLFAVPSLLGFLLGMQVVFAPWALMLLPFMFLIGAVYVALIVLSAGMVAILFARLVPKFKKEALSMWLALPIGALLAGILASLPMVGLLLTLILGALGVGGMIGGKFLPTVKK